MGWGAGVGGVSRGSHDAGSGGGWGVGYSMHDQAMAGLSGPQAAALGRGGVSSAATAKGWGNSGSAGSSNGVDQGTWTQEGLMFGPPVVNLSEPETESVKASSPAAQNPAQESNVSGYSVPDPGYSVHGFMGQKTLTGPEGQWAWTGFPGVSSLAYQGDPAHPNYAAYDITTEPYYSTISDFFTKMATPAYPDKPTVDQATQIAQARIATMEDDLASRAAFALMDKGYLGLDEQGNLARTGDLESDFASRAAASLTGQFGVEQAGKFTSLGGQLAVGVPSLGLASWGGMTAPLGALSAMGKFTRNAMMEQALVDRGMLSAQNIDKTSSAREGEGQDYSAQLSQKQAEQNAQSQAAIPAQAQASAVSFAPYDIRSNLLAYLLGGYGRGRMGNLSNLYRSYMTPQQA